MSAPATSEEAYPVLVAEHGDDISREMLRAVARGGGVLVVQLLAAPLVEGRHVLEVHAPGGERERFFAEPVAAPCDLGFPLRLAPYMDAELPPSSVPDLAFDSLPPNRSVNPSSAPTDGSIHAPPHADPNLGGWLQHGSATMQSLQERDIDGAWLMDLAAMDEIAAFKDETAALLPAVGKVLRNGDAQTLSAVITTMRAIIKQEGGKGRAKYAGRVLRFLRDPSRLGAFVDAALGAAEEPAASLKQVLFETQAAAAEALIAGRQRHTGSTARARFVALMRALGPAAMAGLTGALSACLARGERTGELVEDLLCAIPPTADESTGAVVAELLRGGPVATTTSAALAVLPSLWGARARPIVLGALGHPDARVVIVALRGLRSLHAIDAVVVRRLDPIIAGITPAPDAVRIEAAGAIAQALPEARMEAVAVASRAFASGQGSAPLTVALARTLMALGAPDAALLIEQRAARSSDEVRQSLSSLVRPSP